MAMRAVFNKTTSDIVYGTVGKRLTATVPASKKDGERGPALIIDAKSQAAISTDCEAFKKDVDAGYIEVV